MIRATLECDSCGEEVSLECDECGVCFIDDVEGWKTTDDGDHLCASCKSQEGEE